MAVAKGGEDVGLAAATVGTTEAADSPLLHAIASAMPTPRTPKTQSGTLLNWLEGWRIVMMKRWFNLIRIELESIA